MNFGTYGPFPLRNHSRDGIDAFFSSIDNAHPKLRKGIGIYLVATRKADGSLKPWYVGRTHKSFESRLWGHFKAEKFSQLILEEGVLEVLLLARITGHSKMVRSTEKIRAGGLKSIKLLEFTLIGSCLSKNALLLNKQENTFHTSMHVPGYWNSSVKDYDNAAKELALMVNTKFGLQE